MRVGRYHVTRKLATGGMGELLLAVRRAAGGIERKVVIKRIRKDLSGDVRFVEMFLREAQLSVTLSHKNIVPVFDFGKVGQELFIAMEYVRGRDLGRVLEAARRAGRSLSPPVVAHIGIEVCRALDYAHGRDAPVIHRDLSPKNLLISFAGDVLVADFGLAIGAGELGEGIRGTPRYMSPEQARGDPLDLRSDLFSLGLVLREALEGRKAYSGESPAEIIERARHADLAPLAPEIPAALARVIEVATRADPDGRCQSAREMQDALDLFLVAARAAGARPPSHELADVLGELFDEREPLGKPVSNRAIDEDAITYIDEGIDALAASALIRSARSEAVTVGDSEIEEPRTARWRRPALALALLAGATAIWLFARGRQPAPPVAEATPPADAAALPAIDAAPIQLIDAAAAPVIDAAPISIDAAANERRRPRRAPPAPGSLVVQTDSWARVKIAGTGSGCAETPCTVTLSPGRYRVELTNPTTGAALTREVEIASGEARKLIVEMPIR